MRFRLRSTCRRGFSMVEVLAAVAVLTSLVATWLPLQHTVAKLRRASQWRQVAQFEAAGVLERLAAWPVTDLTLERTAAVDLSEDTRLALPNAQLHIDVQPAADDPAGVRVAVQVTWSETSADQKPRQVELVAWRYAAPQGAQP
ncbi:MAG: prepilin-type N-terminal cleavage/methylation domain-containing protein [Patescibacteria group bacterium]|nr:prepilin-type N-terminal cleavage/methylation domain-containing protein [Patescibacteria group bacterium]